MVGKKASLTALVSQKKEKKFWSNCAPKTSA